MTDKVEKAKTGAAYLDRPAVPGAVKKLPASKRRERARNLAAVAGWIGLALALGL